MPEVPDAQCTTATRARPDERRVGQRLDAAGSGATTSSSCATSRRPPCRTPASSCRPTRSLAPEGTWVASSTARQAAGHRRPVRRDQGPHRRLDDHRRRRLRPGAGAGRRAVVGTRGRRASAGRVAGAAPGDERAPRPSRSDPPRPGRPAGRRPAGAVGTGPPVAEFAAAEDAVQDALVEGLRTWAADPPPGRPRLAGHGRVAPVPGRRPLGRRPPAPGVPPPEEPVEVPGRDDSLQLYFLCAHPSLTPSSAVALTLRAVAG